MDITTFSETKMQDSTTEEFINNHIQPREYERYSIYKGCYILWDEDVDNRIFDLLTQSPEHWGIVFAYEHEACLRVITTKHSFPTSCDVFSGFYDGNLAYDHWTVEESHCDPLVTAEYIKSLLPNVQELNDIVVPMAGHQAEFLHYLGIDQNLTLLKANEVISEIKRLINPIKIGLK